MKKNELYQLLQFLILSFAMQVISVSICTAQDSKPESFYLHTDRNIYLTGESIWYKIYLTDFNKHSDHSKVVYINLHGKNGELLIQQKLKMENGEASGMISIPRTWQEDYYYLTCFSAWNLQFDSEQLVLKKIAVYNPYENPTASEQGKNTSKIQEQEENLSIVLLQEKYSKRASGKIKIESPNRQIASLSVSIHASNGLANRDFSFENSPSRTSAHYANQKQNAKEQSLIIGGKATDPKTGLPVSSDVFSLYKVGGDHFYRISSTDGVIYSGLDDFYGTSDFQLFNMNPYQEAIPDFTLLRAGEKLLGLENEQSFPPRDDAVLAYLKNARLSQKVHEIFEERSYDSLISKPEDTFPFEADKVYLMEKFQSMKTLEEFIREIVVFADVSTVDDKATVRLKNTQTQRFFMEKPWYLVDGYLTRDEEAVLSIPFKNLVRLELFNTNKSILGQLETVMIRSGMIAVYTNNNFMKEQAEAQKNLFQFQGFSRPTPFQAIEACTPSESMENPVFQSLIYWNPDIKIQGEVELEFVSSDQIGEFVIKVEGLSEDGSRLSASETFFVGY